MSIQSEAIWAASPTTTRGSPTPLSSDGKGERIAYASNRSIFVRSIDRPAEAKQYTQHTAATTVARFSPSGFYIASGDVSGQVRVWDAQGAEKTRGEYPIIAGRINDIAWDGDSQRIIAVGDGRERFGHCITADSGNSVGEISGHSAAINCVAVRPRRPLRAATGGDDTSLCFLHGVPFKFHTSKRDTHQRFIYGTQFSPDGATLVSVGADRRIWLYDGVTGEAQHQIGEGVHTGSIFGVSWAPDSRRLATCSADQTVKLWDVETGACTQSWRRGDDDDDDGVVRVAHQQLGVTWPGGRADGLVISVDLEGRLNYFEPRSAQPVRVVRGHQKAITAAALDAEAHTLITGSSDGRVRAWDVATGAADEVIGAAHGSYVTGMAAPAPPESRVYSVGWDDRLWGIDCATRACVGAPVPMPGQPRAVATTSVDGRAFVLVATPEGIQVLSGSETISTHALPAPTCLAAAAHVIAAGTAAHGLHVFHLSATGTLTPQDAPPTPPPSITALALTPDTTGLAVGTPAGKILLYRYSSPSWALETARFSAHTARITALAWRPDARALASASLDTHVHVWSVAHPGSRLRAARAHADGVAAVVWVSEGELLSCGVDGTVRRWGAEGVE